jgi:SAM-dependent methyltransferase
MKVFGRAAQAVTGRLRRYLDWRFDRLEMRVARIGEGVGQLTREQSERTRALDRIDLSAHNRNPARPSLERPVSQVVSASQFFEKDFVRWHRALQPHVDPAVARQSPHRKLWEWVYILRVAELAGVLGAERSAVGFGVGREPIPTVLASFGMHVLATDRDPASSSEWVATDQHMGNIDSFRNAAIVSDASVDELVGLRFVDMNDPLGDLGAFDLVWSSGSMEHLGSPEAGFDFVLRSLELLEPGGVAVHTTELDLVPYPETHDYGNLAAYQPDDLDRLVARIRARGFAIEANWTVPMDMPKDRWVSLSADDADQPAHLKLVVEDSVVTSVGIAARRPTG